MRRIDTYVFDYDSLFTAVLLWAWDVPGEMLCLLHDLLAEAAVIASFIELTIVEVTLVGCV